MVTAAPRDAALQGPNAAKFCQQDDRITKLEDSLKAIQDRQTAQEAKQSSDHAHVCQQFTGVQAELQGLAKNLTAQISLNHERSQQAQNSQQQVTRDAIEELKALFLEGNRSKRMRQTDADDMHDVP